MAWDPKRLEALFSLLPRSSAVALKLAREHDDNVAGQAWLHAGGRRRIRHAVEVRADHARQGAFVGQRQRGVELGGGPADELLRLRSSDQKGEI